MKEICKNNLQDKMQDNMQNDANGFLPVCREDLERLGIRQLDFVYVTGDAYVDHPSFGTAILSRVLQAHGYTVGMIPQPDWKDDGSIAVLGRPRLAFLVSAGNMDSCVNHYYVSKKHRESDAYSPGGEPYKRPDHAAVVYGNLIRRTYRDVPIILGGIEASLRRLAHYDYWSDSFKRSILLDSGADLISYGMGERSIVEIAEALDSGIAVGDLSFIRGTVYRTRDVSSLYDAVTLPDYEGMKRDKLLYAESFRTQYENTDPFTARALVEEYPNQVYVVQNPPQNPLSMQEMDDIYALPYMRTYHPMYEKAGGIPAVAEIKYSLISNRGCFGGCSFCALTFHQGRILQTRSHESILEEARQITQEPGFKGYIHDVGGPTANFRHPSCEKQLKSGVCRHRQCLFPEPCPNLKADHSDYLELLRKLRALPNVKKVFVRSGIRFDYLMQDRDDTFFRELIQHHISGQLKVAPEHICDAVLMRMGKPRNEVYERFLTKYDRLNREMGKKQFVVPYLMSSHPGSTLKEAVELAEYIRDLGYMPQQVQDFYPTPSTMSTVMYYTGVDPRDMRPVYVVRNPHEKAMQRALIQYRDPKNYDLVREALHLAGREDLIGFDKKCLIRPRKLKAEKSVGKIPGKKSGKSPERQNRKNPERQRERSPERQGAKRSGKQGGRIPERQSVRSPERQGGKRGGRQKKE